jgi:hypothetical protein
LVGRAVSAERVTTREFYRIVRGEVPDADDFRSMADLGVECVTGRRYRECAEGISVFDDFEHACAVARDYNFRRGRFIARLVVPDDGSVEFAKTFRDPHHYTIYYGSPESILALVEGAAVPIPGAPGG